ncbi:flavoprotein [Marivirga lumbricoides]|uniref:Flavoprotein n=1 Tax=Marivirga lumbricoides TaxID=1046115 RepID=A0ABQ1MUU6_9BACT|nr:flavoprotein [Marivirga lumbricoides]
MKKADIIIIGAGAAGIFAAINVAEANPGKKVLVVEKSSKLLAKVKVSGGGRCNVTNTCKEPGELIKNYPRGNKKLKKAFAEFGTTDTVNWFSERGVELHAEADGRMFPITNNSQTIIDCLLKACDKYKVEIITRANIETIEKLESSFQLTANANQLFECEKLLISTGGSNKIEGYSWLEKLGHSINPPVPSLFTFNLTDKSITELSGLSVPDAEVKIAGTKLSHRGPLLITHWGLSGPAVLKLSAWGARVLQEKEYQYTVLVNWISGNKEPEVRKMREEFQQENPLKKVAGTPPFQLPKRLWEYLSAKSGIDPELRWNNFSGKNFNKLVNSLVCDEYTASGKTTFKEEFVTCGGVKLGEVNMETLESRICPGLYFAGEVLDIDGVTGGFNFQAAWTTAYLAAKAM